jgi:hypothetical protein
MKLSDQNETFLFEALVEETYKSIDESDSASKLDLSSYFEMRTDINEAPFEDHILEDTMIKRGVAFSVVAYSEATSCFNFTLGDESFTCPENWGQFEELKSFLSYSSYNMLNNFNAELFVDGLFSSYLNYEYEMICFVGNGKAFLIYLPNEHEEILDWLKKYCEVKDLAA